jgi:hypothetical protein
MSIPSNKQFSKSIGKIFDGRNLMQNMINVKIDFRQFFQPIPETKLIMDYVLAFTLNYIDIPGVHFWWWWCCCCCVWRAMVGWS